MSREPFLDLLPTKGWLSDYMEWTMGSEAPAAYHFFVGAAVLSAVIGRKVYFNKGYYKVYPTLQILIVGPTGRTRKTSSINLGLAMLRSFGDVNVISEKTTPEALLDSLQVLPPAGKAM